MYLDNLIKKYAILLTDKINSLKDPFQEFTRPVEEKYPETLVEKAIKFENDFIANFRLFDGKVWNYRIPVGEPTDTGDQALWHGIYTAMWAIKYDLTRNEQDLHRLYLCMDGLEMHQIFHKERRHRLIRGMREDGYWQDDVSNDQMTGHLCGIYYACKYGDIYIRDKASQLINGLAQELVNNEYSLINKNDEPTTYGKLVNGILTDPLRLTLCLATLKFATRHACTETASAVSVYQRCYSDLVNRYYDIIQFPKVKLLSLDTDYDTHRAAIHLSILADIEQVPSIQQQYLDGLKRIWNMTYKSANAWVAYLCAQHVPISQIQINQCKKMLQEFTFEDKHQAVEKINSNDPNIKKFKWRGNYLSPQPLPRWKVGSQDFFWQRNLTSIDAYPGSKTPWTYYNGADFLIAYYGFRQLGFISDKE